jgi:hypothetical protein
VKHCPACNFSFPDFHRVCDFDGTDLVSDPDPLSLVKSPPPSRFRRTLQSPLLWGGALAFAAVSNAFLFSLYDAGSQSTTAVKAQPSPTSIGKVTPSAPARESGAHSEPEAQPLDTPQKQKVQALIGAPAPCAQSVIVSASATAGKNRAHSAAATDHLRRHSTRPGR